MDSRSKYPIYIVSKGRYENTLTADSFDVVNVPYLIIKSAQVQK